jgi:hypothetical protein
MSEAAGGQSGHVGPVVGRLVDGTSKKPQTVNRSRSAGRDREAGGGYRSDQIQSRPVNSHHEVIACAAHDRGRASL